MNTLLSIDWFPIISAFCISAVVGYAGGWAVIRALEWWDEFRD